VSVSKLERGGLVPGGEETSHDNGGVGYVLEDTKTHIEEEGLEVNIPIEILNLTGKYKFTGKNFIVLNEILKLGKYTSLGKELTLANDVSRVRAGDVVICIRSVWDDTEYTYEGTILEIVSAINVSGGCNHIESGAKVTNEETGETKVLKNGGVLKIGDYTEIGKIEDEYGTQFKINGNWYAKSIVKPGKAKKQTSDKIVKTKNKDYYNGIRIPKQVNPNTVISSFQNEMDWDKVERYTQEMKEKMLSHDFPPITGFPSIINESDIGQKFLNGNEITEEDIGKQVWKVTDGHHRAISAINAELPYIEVELDYSTITDPNELEKGGQLNSDESILNSNGGYDYTGEAKKIAKRCGLTTLPKSVPGTNCGNCIFFSSGFCDHYKVLLPVTSRQCCKFWDDKSVLSHLTNVFDAYFFPDKSATFPLNERGGYDYSGKALDRAREADLITLPENIEGTTCAEKNCMYGKENICIHPKILLPITDRQTCGWWNNEDVIRPWGEPVESEFGKGGKVGMKERLKDWQADVPNSPRWKKKKDAIIKLSNTVQKLRNKLRRDLNSEDERDFLTALVISIMDKTGERVGNPKSADKGHFGVTGFERSHIKIVGNKIILDYVGKTGVPHEKDFSDEGIAKALKRAMKNSPKEIKGKPNEFIFVTTKGIQTSGKQVNDYLKEFGITSKNLRGYFSNYNIIKLLKREAKKEEPQNDKQRKKIFNKVLKQTAVLVGHNPPTLRKHYMIPELPIEYIQNGNIIDLKTYGYYQKGGELGDIPVEKYFANKNDATLIVENKTAEFYKTAEETEGGISELFKSCPVKTVEWKDIVPTQDFLRLDKSERLKSIEDIYSIGLPWLIEYDGKFYVNDGHHRVLEMHQRNLPVKGHVYEIKSEQTNKNTTMKNTEKTKGGKLSMKERIEMKKGGGVNKKIDYILSNQNDVDWDWYNNIGDESSGFPYTKEKLEKESGDEIQQLYQELKDYEKKEEDRQKEERTHGRSEMKKGGGIDSHLAEVIENHNQTIADYEKKLRVAKDGKEKKSVIRDIERNITVHKELLADAQKRAGKSSGSMAKGGGIGKHNDLLRKINVQIRKHKASDTYDEGGEEINKIFKQFNKEVFVIDNDNEASEYLLKATAPEQLEYLKERITKSSGSSMATGGNTGGIVIPEIIHPDDIHIYLYKGGDEKIDEYIKPDTFASLVKIGNYLAIIPHGSMQKWKLFPSKYFAYESKDNWLKEPMTVKGTEIYKLPIEIIGESMATGGGVGEMKDEIPKGEGRGKILNETKHFQVNVSEHPFETKYFYSLKGATPYFDSIKSQNKDVDLRKWDVGEKEYDDVDSFNAELSYGGSMGKGAGVKKVLSEEEKTELWGDKVGPKTAPHGEYHTWGIELKDGTWKETNGRTEAIVEFAKEYGKDNLPQYVKDEIPEEAKKVMEGWIRFAKYNMKERYKLATSLMRIINHKDYNKSKSSVGSMAKGGDIGKGDYITYRKGFLGNTIDRVTDECTLDGNQVIHTKDDEYFIEGKDLDVVKKHNPQMAKGGKAKGILDVARKGIFSIDSIEGKKFNGYTFGDDWNGWAVPYFETQETYEIARELGGRKVYDKKPYFMFPEHGENEGSYADLTDGPYKQQEIKTEDGKKNVYPVGAYNWVWEEVDAMAKGGTAGEKRITQLENAITEAIGIIGDDDETKEEYKILNSKRPSIDKLETTLYSLVNKIKDEYGEDDQWKELHKILTSVSPAMAKGGAAGNYGYYIYVTPQNKNFKPHTWFEGGWFAEKDKADFQAEQMRKMKQDYDKRISFYDKVEVRPATIDEKLYLLGLNLRVAKKGGSAGNKTFEFTFSSGRKLTADFKDMKAARWAYPQADIKELKGDEIIKQELKQAYDIVKDVSDRKGKSTITKKQIHENTGVSIYLIEKMVYDVSIGKSFDDIYAEIKNQKEKGGSAGETSEQKNRIKEFLKKFPKDATSYKDATDELPDLHRFMSELYNEETPKEKYRGYEGKTVTASQRNTKHREGIEKLLNLMNNRQIDITYKHYENWFA